ncbi:MAG: Gfo/Idh/MocA family oxidoreductase, partial [Verrucomicrobia bacterium]|nr:Gfo/Idh/MocA family oxidoreductase [Verrucomicrobiota bacterium]
MVKIGIIGLGFMGATHLKALRQVQGAQVTAFCNPSGRNLDGDFSSVAGNLPGQEPLRWNMEGVATFRDPHEFLKHADVDLVDICAPTIEHRRLADAALESGRHVICEKPLARNSQEARQILSAAARHHRFVMPAMCLRFLPSWVWLRDAIQSGKYGRVHGAHFRRVAQPPAWGQAFFLDGAKSGGALLDLHIHDTDFVRFCFGDPQSVYSSGFSKVTSAVDHVMTHYEVASGASVTAEGGWAMAP